MRVCDLCKSREVVSFDSFLNLCFMVGTTEEMIIRRFDTLCDSCYNQVVSHLETSVNMICQKLEK